MPTLPPTPSPAPSPSDELLGQYLAGQLAPDEADNVRAYLEIHPGRRGVIAGIHAAACGADWAQAPSVEATHDEFMARLAREEIEARNTRRGTPSESERGRFSNGMRRVLTLGTAAAATAIIWIAARDDRARPSEYAGHPLRTYTTVAGQRASVTLPDGTHLTLAPRTTVRILAFDVQARTLALDGEAYIHVANAAQRTFTVRTGNVSTHVLGTTFDVVHYPHDPEVRVTVAEGRVLVRGRDAKRSTVTVVAGTVARVTDSTALTTRVTDVDQYTSWTSGTLVFRGTTVHDMLVTVGRWYGYDFRLADTALARQHVDFEIDGRSTASTLRAIQQLLGVRMTFDGAVVTLYPEGESAHTVPTRRTPAPVSPSFREYGR